MEKRDGKIRTLTPERNNHPVGAARENMMMFLETARKTKRIRLRYI